MEGLVRPYGDGHVKKRDRIENLDDPFSIYDDNEEQSHYFFVPGGKMSSKNFIRVFKELNSTQKPSVHSTRTNNKPTYHRPPSGEYCILSRDAKIEKLNSQNMQPNRFSCSKSTSQSIKKENFEHFASKFVSTDINSSYDKKESCVKFDKTTGNCGHTVDSMIDYCTCMLCVRAVSYHWTSDDTDEYVEPCSCAGSAKGIAGRWFCMGLLALIFPCLFCYVPAKLCRNSVKKCSKLKDDDSYKVTYVKDSNDNPTKL